MDIHLPDCESKAGSSSQGWGLVVMSEDAVEGPITWLMGPLSGVVRHLLELGLVRGTQPVGVSFDCGLGSLGECCASGRGGAPWQSTYTLR